MTACLDEGPVKFVSITRTLLVQRHAHTTSFGTENVSSSNPSFPLLFSQSEFRPTRLFLSNVRDVEVSPRMSPTLTSWPASSSSAMAATVHLYYRTKRLEP